MAAVHSLLLFLIQFSLVQLLSRVQLFETPWTTACQVSLSITNSQSLLKFMSIESVMPSNHLILCRPLLPLPSIFPSISVFSIESVLRIRWSKCWSFSVSISPSNEYSELMSFILTGWISLQSKGLSRVFSNTTVEKHQFFCAQLSLSSNSHIHMDFPCGSAGKESACNVGDLGLIPGLGRSLGEGNGYPCQYPGLENSVDCIVRGVAESDTAE